MDKEVRDLNSGACGAGTSPSQPTAVPRTAKGPRGEVGAERRVRGQRKNADGHEHPLTLTLSPGGGEGTPPTPWTTSTAPSSIACKMVSP
jgi:hypothetical protein